MGSSLMVGCWDFSGKTGYGQRSSSGVGSENGGGGDGSLAQSCRNSGVPRLVGGTSNDMTNIKQEVTCFDLDTRRLTGGEGGGGGGPEGGGGGGNTVSSLSESSSIPPVDSTTYLPLGNPTSGITPDPSSTQQFERHQLPINHQQQQNQRDNTSMVLGTTVLPDEESAAHSKGGVN